MVFSKTYKDTENVGEPRRRRQKRSLASEAVGSRLKTTSSKTISIKNRE